MLSPRLPAKIGITTRMRYTLTLSAGCLVLLLFVAASHTHSQHILAQQVLQAAPGEAAIPKRILWVWERPEDLHHVDARSTGIAVLEETLRLGFSATPIPRHQPLLVPEGVTRIAVVRVETDRTFAAHKEEPALLASAVANLSRLSRQSGIAALQIDFDARKSERAFYRRLLTQLRQQAPPTLPIEITALVSWCSTDDWISNLPVNAAIPMFFRMEPDRRGGAEYVIREPLCARSVGVSTTEP